MKRLRPYPAYKPTGLAWLPEVPEGWECVRLGSFFTDDVKANKDFAYTRAFKFSYGELIPKDEIGDAEEYRDVYVKYSVLRKDDILINGLNLNYDFVSQRVARSPMEGIITSAYLVLRPREGVCSSYFTYLFKTMDNKKMFHGMGTGIRLTLSFKELKAQRIPSPPTPIQRAIVAYLDDKCGKVDRLVAAKEKEAALLKELKQPMIAEAVTGATKVARTDTARKMKPSGIPWLPEVPEGWEVKKVRQLAREGKTKNKGNVEKNVLSLSYGRIIRKKDVYSGLVPTDFATYQIVEKDYVVLRLTDLQNDHKSLRCGLVRERGIITSAYVSLVPQNVLPEYLYLALHACDLNKVFYSMGGGLRQSMNFADVGNIVIPLPSLDEQREIVAYIEARAAKIDAAVKGLEREVAALKEYKQRLIADVVTGQRKVA